MSSVVYTLPIEDFEWAPDIETLKFDRYRLAVSKGYSILEPPDEFVIIGKQLTITFEYYTTINKARLYTIKQPELVPERLQAIRVLIVV